MSVYYNCDLCKIVIVESETIREIKNELSTYHLHEECAAKIDKMLLASVKLPMIRIDIGNGMEERI